MPIVADNQVFYVDSADPIPAKEYLQGYLELENTLIVGTGGLRKFRQENGEVPLRQPLDGAFIGFFKASSECILTTDISGQELLYYYQHGSEWAVCNSLYFLHNAIKKNGWPLTPHHQAIQSLGTHAWNAQPYTQQTVFKEVRLLSPTEFVTVPNQTDTKSGPVLPEIKDHTWAKVLKPDEPGNLKALIQEALISSFRTMRAFASIDSDFEVICQVSGGYDSRTCLALLSHCTNHTSQIHAQSNKSSPQELKVAELVTEQTSIALNQFKRRRIDISTEHAYRIWKLSSLGSYIPIYTTHYSSPSYGVQVKGDLSTSLSKSIYGTHSLALRNRARSKVASEPLKQFISRELNGFRDKILRQGFSEQAVTMLLYTEYRSRFHCGRRWAKRLSLYGMVYSPLTNSKVMRAAILAGEQGYSLKQFKMQLLLAADELIATQPYSDPDKNFTTEELNQRLFDTSIEFTQAARNVFIVKEDYAASYAPCVKDQFSNTEFLRLLKSDFLHYREKLKSAGFVSEDLLELAEQELKRENGSLSHHYRHVSLCVNLGFAYFG